MISFPDKKYNIIYADPAWSYNDKRDKHKRLCGGATVHYETMPMKKTRGIKQRSVVLDVVLWMVLSVVRRT